MTSQTTPDRTSDEQQLDHALRATVAMATAWHQAALATANLYIQLAQQEARTITALPTLGYQLSHALLAATFPFMRAGATATRDVPASSHTAQRQRLVTVGPNTSFYFRGPEHRLNLPVDNLAHFLQVAQEVDDATWLYHLRRGDYTHWFRTTIKDEELAVAAAELEHADLPAHASRLRMRALIEQRYSL